MKWKLKPGVPPIQITDGPLTGKTYLPGAVYDEAEIPDHERWRFLPAEPEPVGATGRPPLQPDAEPEPPEPADEPEPPDQPDAEPEPARKRRK